MGRKALAKVVVSVVTAVWACSFVADIVLPNFDVNPLLHAMMLVIVGAVVKDLFEVDINIGRKKDREFDDGEEDTAA